jgi:hypothetical protein
MGQPTMPAPRAAAGFPTFCGACGGPLPGPVPRCPRCAAVITAHGARKSSSAVTIVAVVVAILLGVPCVLGVLAAIAIPNFLKYQLRSKEAEVVANLSALVKAEDVAFRERGAYVPFNPLPGGPPGRQKRSFSPGERAIATELGWMVTPQTYGEYMIALGHAEDGRQSASFCAETDLDGDTVRASHVAFLVPPGADPGAVPPAPCQEPVPYQAGFRPGEVVKISADGVF